MWISVSPFFGRGVLLCHARGGTAFPGGRLKRELGLAYRVANRRNVRVKKTLTFLPMVYIFYVYQ